MLKHLPRPTKTYRTEAYDAISPDRPELSLKGKTVLITGGATGIGLETSKAFAQAGTARLVLVARSQGPMTEAKKDIETAFPKTKVESFAASITDSKRINEVVQQIGKIDILVLNAATMPKPSPVLNSSADDLETTFATNVYGPLNMIKAFHALPNDDKANPRTILYTSTAGITSPMGGTSVYNSSKNAMTFLMRCIDAEYGSTGLRTFAFHPAIAYTPMARDVLGLKEDSAPYDNKNLPAQFAVWLCSPEADFLKGRFLWAMWDVEELKAKKTAIEDNSDALKIGLLLDGVAE